MPASGHGPHDARHKEVSCRPTLGEYDFLLQVVAPDLPALGELMLRRRLKSACLLDVHSSIVLDIIKRSARIPLGHLT